MNSRNSIPFLTSQQITDLSEQLFNTNARCISDDYLLFTRAFDYICKNTPAHSISINSHKYLPHSPYESTHRDAIKNLERSNHKYLEQEASSLCKRLEKKLKPDDISTRASSILPFGREMNKFKVAILVETLNIQRESVIPFAGDWIRYKNGPVWKMLTTPQHPELPPVRTILFSLPAYIEDCERIKNWSCIIYVSPTPSLLLKRGLQQIQVLVNNKSEDQKRVDESSLLGIRKINSSENRYSFQINTLFGDFWLVATWCGLSLQASVKCREVFGRSTPKSK